MKVNSIEIIIFCLTLINLSYQLTNTMQCPIRFKCSNDSSFDDCAKIEVNEFINIMEISFIKSFCIDDTYCNLQDKECYSFDSLSYPYMPGDFTLNPSKCTYGITDDHYFCTGIAASTKCNNSLQCENGYHCVNNSNSFQCLSKYKIDTPCTFDSDCENYLICEDQICAPGNSSTILQSFFPMCSSTPSGFCISKGSLKVVPTNLSGNCIYDNLDVAPPDCTAEGRIICNYGLKDVPDLADSILNYILTLPNCPNAWPICERGATLSNLLLYNSSLNGLITLFRIKERINNVRECIDQYIFYMRTNGSNNPFYQNIQEVSTGKATFTQIYVNLINNLISQNPSFVLEYLPPIINNYGQKYFIFPSIILILLVSLLL